MSKPINPNEGRAIVLATGQTIDEYMAKRREEWRNERHAEKLAVLEKMEAVAGPEGNRVLAAEVLVELLLDEEYQTVRAPRKCAGILLGVVVTRGRHHVRCMRVDRPEADAAGGRARSARHAEKAHLQIPPCKNDCSS